MGNSHHIIKMTFETTSRDKHFRANEGGWGVLHGGTGFDLTIRDSYFTILIVVFTKHILAENAYSTNHLGGTERKIMVLTCKQVRNYPRMS